MHSRKLELPASTSQEKLLEVVADLNADEDIDGILVQSPLPPHMDEGEVVRAINPAKDVDGFHPENVAKLALEDPSGFVPCTPLGCQRLLEAYAIDPAGKHVVIVGRSLIVGKSLALLLMAKGPWANATVTVAHSRTQDLVAVTRQADILVAAVGVPEMLGAEHVPGRSRGARCGSQPGPMIQKKNAGIGCAEMSIFLLSSRLPARSLLFLVESVP